MNYAAKDIRVRQLITLWPSMVSNYRGNNIKNKTSKEKSSLINQNRQRNTIPCTYENMMDQMPRDGNQSSQHWNARNIVTCQICKKQGHGLCS